VSEVAVAPAPTPGPRSAFVNRLKSASQKRLMLLSLISLLGAPIARVTAMIPQLPICLDATVFTAFAVGMGYCDVETSGKIRPETQYGGPAIIVVTLAAMPIGSTAGWQNVASWMMGSSGRREQAFRFRPIAGIRLGRKAHVGMETEQSWENVIFARR
jgi:hypothetical protein